MFKFSIKLIVIALIVSSVFMPIFVNASNASVVSQNEVLMGYEAKSGMHFIKSLFNPSHTIEAGEGFSLVSGKNVKQSYVRAQSDGSTVLGIKVCDAYDSNRVYSGEAPSYYKPNILYSTSKVTVKKCNLCMQRLNYGWFYY